MIEQAFYLYHLTFSNALLYTYYCFSSGHGYFDFFQQEIHFKLFKNKQKRGFTKIYYLTEEQFGLVWVKPRNGKPLDTKTAASVIAPFLNHADFYFYIWLLVSFLFAVFLCLSSTILHFQPETETRWQLLHFNDNFGRGNLMVLVWIKCPFQATISSPKRGHWCPSERRGHEEGLHSENRCWISRAKQTPYRYIYYNHHSKNKEIETLRR